MSYLPPSSNAQYAGAPVAAWFLMLSSLLEIVPGCIHYFLPDGGAGVIAGLDLTHNRSMILALFAWTGSVQIPFGIALFIVGLRYRTLVPLFLSLNMLERFLMSLSGWVLRPPGAGGHHPPEHYGSPVSVLLLGIFLYLSLSRRKAD